MTKRYYALPVGGETLRLRLTMAGQRRLKEQWGEDILPFLLGAAVEGEKLCSLLTQCLTWPESGNPVTDGEALYDLLVDEGWQGQTRFAGLVFALGEHSGVLTPDQAQMLNQAVGKGYQAAFEALA